ncbi:DHH family phosphoesterase, partial [Massilia oculi]|uniref:DHH family phosphoesterase n=1 Tax=Massilia oculi TaxID=945844 RepID=UPI00351D5A91
MGCERASAAARNEDGHLCRPRLAGRPRPAAPALTRAPGRRPGARRPAGRRQPGRSRAGRRLERLAAGHAASRRHTVRAAAGCPQGWPRARAAPGPEQPRGPCRLHDHRDGAAQILAPPDIGFTDLTQKTRISTRPCPFRISELLRQDGVHPVLARIYAARGLEHVRELSSELAALSPPSGLKHIDTAAVFLADAIQSGKRMTIVADYDCDGATACAVALRGLRAMGAEVDYFVPNRVVHGYGLTPGIVEITAREKNPDIIVTVDNGIASIEGVLEANRLGIEVVVTDHHL